MVKKQTSKSKRVPAKVVAPKSESDSTFLFKIVLYVIFGALWLKFAIPLHVGPWTIGAFPLGLILGLVFASHENFQIDRKIEYAILVMMTVLTFFVPAAILL